ncbi:MAG: FAD-binding oxidoreductase [Sphingomonadaceae bacterium]|nr:FAD-binding oxidoreductase [Sphingomonadaceae bacterium]
MIRVAIVGAGMAGASLAAEIGEAADVLLLEAESRPGYHSTGRSAAFWAESYGGPLIRPLTSGSGPFLGAHGFLKPRGAIHLADAASRSSLDALAAAFPGMGFAPLGRAALEAAIPGLKPGRDFGLAEPSCADIDVAGLHDFYLRRAGASGARLVTDARLRGASRTGGRWRIDTTGGSFDAEIIVDAAGAWADEVAASCGVRPLGIQPYRRNIAQLRVTPPAPDDLPLIIDAAGLFYVKAESGGRIWLSPHDETPSPPCDCAPEEIDVALAIDRLERVVDWRVEAVERKWAGLRSFAPDRLPVYGYDGAAEGFFWFAGQGGFGIQTAPAAAALGAALLLGGEPELDPAPYSALRFAN